MPQRERFLPGFNHILCGRPPRAALTRLEEKLRVMSESSLSDLTAVFGAWVPVWLLEAKASGAHSRRRLYSLQVTFWAFLSQVLSPATPCREVVRRVQRFCSEKGLAMPTSNTSAYCQARGRLELEDLNGAHEAVCAKLLGRVREAQRWKGHEVRVLDGTGVSLPDTAAHQAEFPQPGEQRPGCGFPVMKLVACFCLSSGALLKWVETSLKSHESRILKEFLSFFRAGEVVLTDRGFSSWSNLAVLMSKGVHAVMRAHQCRQLDYRQGRRLGRYDRLVSWQKPQRLKGWDKAQWDALPEQITVRIVRIFIEVKGFRVRRYDLVTTLTDASTYTREDLAELYYRRWSVELYFRHIKTTMGMERLRCETPSMVRKELQMFVLAYNLIRGLMQEAAEVYLRPLERLSFKATVDTLRQFAPALHATATKPRRQRAILEEMLLLIAEETVPERPHRSEPRAVKRRPKPFQRLTRHRREFTVSKSRKNKGSNRRKTTLS
jgi:hypothetical protein